MPVITVTIGSQSPVDRGELLAAVNLAASTALGLPTDGVHSVLVESVAARTGQRAAEPWPIAVLHGRRRDSVHMAAAVDGVAAVLAEHLGCRVNETWVQWAANG